MNEIRRVSRAESGRGLINSTTIMIVSGAKIGTTPSASFSKGHGVQVRSSRASSCNMALVRGVSRRALSSKNYRKSVTAVSADVTTASSTSFPIRDGKVCVNIRIVITGAGGKRREEKMTCAQSLGRGKKTNEPAKLCWNTQAHHLKTHLADSFFLNLACNLALMTSSQICPLRRHSLWLNSETPFPSTASRATHGNR